MKPNPCIAPILAVSLAFITPAIAIAHVGHGDEFQATGDIQRVEVNPETDSMMGIAVSPIAQVSESGMGVTIPATALIDADGKQIVFVQYENFYEPVEVKTGATQGDFIEVTEGLSIGEQLVTQGSLSLYAESRKTQTAEVEPSTDAIAVPETANINAEADPSDNITPPLADVPPESNGFPIGMLALGGGAVLAIAAGGVFIANGKRKGGFSNNKGS